MQRSNEPFFWGLFGAGGMLTAICAPILIFVVLILPTFGAPGALKVFYGSALGRLFIWVFISLGAWCALHRIVHCLHDMRWHWSKTPLFCYGLALVMTLLGLYGALV
jgi:fumarate reductase subunit D